MNNIQYAAVRQYEDHPGNPGWWRWSRPRRALGTLPTATTTRQVWYTSKQELAQDQAEWDAKYPKG